MDPKMLAEFLNQLDNKKDSNLSYDKVIASYVRDLDQGLTHVSRIRDTQVRTDFLQLINQLNPELRQELLSERFSFSTRSAEASTDVLNLSPAKIVLKVLEEVNQAGGLINHGVFQLVDMLAASGRGMKRHEEQSWEFSPEEQWRFADDTLAFFSGANLDRRPVSREERALLQQARQKLITYMGTGGGREAKPAREGGGGLSGLEENYAGLLLDLMEKESSEDKAQGMARGLAGLLAAFVAEGRWGLAVSIWGCLSALEEPDPARPTFLPDLCVKVKNQFWAPENISRISAAILQKGLRESEALVDILRESCQQSAREMVDTLAEEGDEGVRLLLLDLVADLSAFTLPHVLEHLPHDDPRVVIDMLRVLQKVRDYDTMKQVAALVEHPDSGVALEAIRALVMMGSAFAPEIVVRHLDHPDRRLALGTIALAGQIYDPRIIEGLLNVVRIKSWRPGEYDLERRKKAVAALAAIGASEALPTLYKLVTARKLIHSKEFELLKLEVFRSLSSYDSRNIGPFLEWGRNCGNMEINNVCTGLVQRAGAAGSRT
ncbi:MAG: HEAT repeat domain-containing protein [Pseudomonadota bacterium]